MTVSYAMLLAADPARWVDSAVAWRRLSRALDDHHDELAHRLTRQEEVWHGGTAAVAARESGAALVRRLATAPPALLEVDQLLWRHAERIRLLQRRLAEALSAVRGTAVQVSADGQVSVVVPDAPRPGPPGLAGGHGSVPAGAVGQGGRHSAVPGGVGQGGSRGAVPGGGGQGSVPAGVVGWADPATRAGAYGGSLSGRVPGASDVALAMRVSPRSTRSSGRRGRATRTSPDASPRWPRRPRRRGPAHPCHCPRPAPRRTSHAGGPG